jgi:hypothetical protein
MIVNRQFSVFVSINNEQNPVMFHVVLIVLFITILWCFRTKKPEIFSKIKQKTQYFCSDFVITPCQACEKNFSKKEITPK